MRRKEDTGAADLGTNKQGIRQAAGVRSLKALLHSPNPSESLHTKYKLQFTLTDMHVQVKCH